MLLTLKLKAHLHAWFNSAFSSLGKWKRIKLKFCTFVRFQGQGILLRCENAMQKCTDKSDVYMNLKDILDKALFTV